MNSELSTVPAGKQEVLIFADEFGVLVQGPAGAASAAIERLVSDSGITVGEKDRFTLAEMGAAAATVAAAADSSGEYLRLTADAAAKVKEFGPQLDSTGALRGYVRNNGRFSGQLSFDQVSVAGNQALALQSAAVAMALRSAIANVQEAVERVEHKVDQVSQHLNARLRGDVIGTYRHLQEVTDGTVKRGHLLEADWASVASARNQIQRDLETLRSAVTKAVDDVTLKLNVSQREDRFEFFVTEAGNVGDMLQLILISEQSLHLYEFLRLERVRSTDVDHVESALADARKTLLTQRELDEQLVNAMTGSVERGRVIRPLEVHRVFSRRDLDAHGAQFYDRITEFAEAARVPAPAELATMTQATIAEARNEVKTRGLEAAKVAKTLGSAAAHGGGSAILAGRERVKVAISSRRGKQDAD